MKTIYNSLFKENAVLTLALGLCSTLALSNKVESAYVMGLCVLFILLFSNLTIALIRKLIPDNVRIPVYILIVGTFVTIIEILMKNYVPNLYEVLGIYLPLIVVNCIILGKALAITEKTTIKDAFNDAIGTGLGFTIVLVIIALIREIIGAGTITLMDSLSTLTGYKAVYQVYPDLEILPFSLFQQPAGAFIVLGLVMAIYKHIKDKERA